MTFLSDVPFDSITIGMEVISAKNTPGKVIEKRSPGYRGEDNDIVIQWDSGNFTDTWHMWCDKVTIKE